MVFSLNKRILNLLKPAWNMLTKGIWLWCSFVQFKRCFVKFKVYLLYSISNKFNDISNCRRSSETPITLLRANRSRRRPINSEEIRMAWNSCIIWKRLGEYGCDLQKHQGSWCMSALGWLVLRLWRNKPWSRIAARTTKNKLLTYGGE